MAEPVEPNRYAAPAVPLETPAPATMRRPGIVWITQMLACVYLVSSVGAVVRNVRLLMAPTTTGMMAWSTKVSLGSVLLVTVLVLAMIVFIEKRSPLGRWFAVIFVGQLLIFGLLGLPHLPSYAQHGNLGGVIVFAVFMLGLLGWWLYAIGFSRQSRAWFTKTDQAAAPSAPH